MDANLERICRTYVSNRDAIHKSSLMSYSMMADAGALMYTSAKKPADTATVKMCGKIIKQHVGGLSNMRGHMRLPVMVKMSLHDDPERYFNYLLSVYQKLTESKVFRSEYLVLAAMAIADNCDATQVDEAVQKTYALHRTMREDHPVITESADLTMAAVLATAPIDASSCLDEAERCYALLKDEHFKLAKDTVQAVSHVLALSPLPAEEKCQRFLRLRQMMKDAGHRIGNGRELAILAALVDIDVPDEELISQIGEVDSWLKTQRGFGAMGTGAQLRRMIAATLVLEGNDRAAVGTSATLGASLATTVAEQIIISIITTIIITSAVVSSSHSSSAS